MTIYFPNDLVAGIGTDVFFDGDLRGITAQDPNGWNTYWLQLISNYTNRDIAAEEETQTDWYFELRPIVQNERYSQFVIEDLSDTWAQNQFRSGYYEFKLHGSYLDIEWDQVNEPGSFTLLQSGLAKLKTKTTDDLQRGNEDEVVKYTTDPNTAQSYVIYNP